LAELVEIIGRAGLVDLETGTPVDVLAGAKGEPPARPFEPFGIALRARKPAPRPDPRLDTPPTTRPPLGSEDPDD
jgi:hypothetical protein